jgi:hypothetical protein
MNRDRALTVPPPADAISFIVNTSLRENDRSFAASFWGNFPPCVATKLSREDSYEPGAETRFALLGSPFAVVGDGKNQTVVRAYKMDPNVPNAVVVESVFSNR